MFGVIVLMGVIIAIIDSVFVFTWNLEKNDSAVVNLRFTVKVAYLFLVVPCVILIIILADVIRKLQSVKLKLSKTQIILLLGSIVCFTLSLLYDSIMQFTQNYKTKCHMIQKRFDYTSIAFMYSGLVLLNLILY